MLIIISVGIRVDAMSDANRAKSNVGDATIGTNMQDKIIIKHRTQIQ